MFKNLYNFLFKKAKSLKARISHDNHEEIDLLIQKYLNFITVLDHLILNSLNVTEILPEYKVKIETILVKFSLNSKSFVKLITSKETNFVNHNVDYEIQDISSIYILGRSLLENYLTFFYLFILESDNEDSIKYKNWIFEMSGFSSRQNAPMNSMDNAIQNVTERKIIEKLREKIIDNIEFQKLDTKTKKRILNENSHMIPAKIYSWAKLFELSELDKKSYLSTWSIYSNFAHSEYISLMQINTLLREDNNNTMNSFVKLSLEGQIHLISHLIINFCNLFESVKSEFDSKDEDLIEEIKQWHIGAKEKDR